MTTCCLIGAVHADEHELVSAVVISLQEGGPDEKRCPHPDRHGGGPPPVPPGVVLPGSHHKGSMPCATLAGGAFLQVPKTTFAEGSSHESPSLPGHGLWLEPWLWWGPGEGIGPPKLHVGPPAEYRNESFSWSVQEAAQELHMFLAASHVGLLCRSQVFRQGNGGGPPPPLWPGPGEGMGMGEIDPNEHGWSVALERAMDLSRLEHVAEHSLPRMVVISLQEGGPFVMRCVHPCRHGGGPPPVLGPALLAWCAGAQNKGSKPAAMLASGAFKQVPNMTFAEGSSHVSPSLPGHGL